jgi:hypothetical protein
VDSEGFYFLLCFPSQEVIVCERMLFSKVGDKKGNGSGFIKDSDINQYKSKLAFLQVLGGDVEIASCRFFPADSDSI